ncbi:MAG TPA: SMI1/KNR4 family protein [Candidatus Limnocylindrales bacterium]|nr:SMI1/KNR4 family protein [Candidatus Limnocylindrales bacterium]
MSAEGEFGRDVERLAAALAARGHRLDLLAHPGAAESQIAGCERLIGRSLPPSFRRFLRESDGLSMSIDHEPGLSPD